MTSEDHDPALDPVDEERVRRLLADAAPGPGSLPEDVAARLDTVIAGLAAERAATSADPDPDTGRDDLARRRTRRRWAGALLAAAAVVVAVVAVRPVLSGGPTQSAGSASTAAKAPSGGDLLGPGSPGVQGFRSYRLGGPPPRLSSDRLAADVRRLGLEAQTPRTGRSPEAGRPRCALPAPRRDADLIAVLLDGRPATLVLVPEAGGTREALVYACGDGTTVLARASVPRG